MAEKKHTKYPGVLACESSERRFRGKADISYMIEFRDVGGKRVRKVVGWASQGMTAALASQKRAEIISGIKNGEIFSSPRKKANLTFAQAWEKYKNDWLIANGKNPTQAQSRINQWLSGLANLALADISTHQLEKIAVTMRTHNCSPQSIKHALALVRAIMRRMAAWKLYSGPMPFSDIALPKPNNARVRFLTPQEAKALLDELKRRSSQMWLMALISLHCGMRFGEIAKMQFGHLNFQEKSIYIPESKSGMARHAVMTDAVADALKHWPQGQPFELVFPARGGGIMAAASDSFTRAVKALGLNDGIVDRRQKVVFHTLRHTYASWLAKNGQSQFVIADRLGHHSLDMTKRYTHLMDSTRKESADIIGKIFTGDPSPKS